MNNGIKQLATAAGMVLYPTGLGIQENTLWGDRNIEQLCKLVALQCCILMYQNNNDTSSAQDAIHEYFGITA